ncbi:hypothetical protein PV08_02731 [Exophiala spinifera]|uniref:Alpha/beta hydrolase fold-3 domain-containing protein n=1 Tax=Exophiala spinifera TaxID=91928 RepID=A0A0D2BHM3_9EURO|nr:uncharacterized protein PV08_02731 [Exophiala spinifera]KIW18443.1 hypothetical protein PV08_02731 [Exophiala spinifera]
MDGVQSVLPRPNAEMLYQAFGISPDSVCELLRPDMNFFEELAELPVDLLKAPLGTDVEGMRAWVEETLLNGPLAEQRNNSTFERRRKAVPVKVHDVRIPCANSGDGDSFSLRVYDPEIDPEEQSIRPRPAILMLHGGGWIHGKPHGDDVFAKFFASEVRAVCLGVDYRLAPEHPFPAAFEDCCQSIDWVMENAPAYNIDIRRLGLWGASAGGNLAAAVALKHSQRDSQSHQPQLKLISLVVPVTAAYQAQHLFERSRELELSSNEKLFRDAPLPTAAVVEGFDSLIKLYTGGKTDECHPFISPLLAKPSKRHARTHITVAACDDLRAQGLAYAQLLRSSGVAVSEEVLQGVPHGFTFPLEARVVKSWLRGQVDRFVTAFEDEVE